MKNVERVERIDLEWLKDAFRDSIVTHKNDFRLVANSLLPENFVDHGVLRINSELKEFVEDCASSEVCSDYHSVCLWFDTSRKTSYKTFEREWEVSYLTFKNRVFDQILATLESKLKQKLESFRPEYALLTILTHQSEVEVIDFLASKVSDKWERNKKWQYFKSIKKHIQEEIATIFEESVGWQFVNFYRWNLDKGKMDHIQINYEGIILWLDSQLRLNSCEMKLQNVEKQRRLIELLTTSNLTNSKVLEFDCSSDRISQVSLNHHHLASHSVEINHPDLLVAIIGWLKFNNLLLNGPTEIIHWLQNIGIEKHKGFSTRSLWDKIENKFLVADVLKSFGLDLHSIFAVPSGKPAFLNR